MSTEKGEPSWDSTAKHRNIKIACMVRSDQNSTLFWDEFNPDHAISKQQPAQCSEQYPKESIDDPTHSFTAITAIMRSKTCSTVSTEVSIT